MDDGDVNEEGDNDDWPTLCPNLDWATDDILDSDDNDDYIDDVDNDGDDDVVRSLSFSQERVCGSLNANLGVIIPTYIGSHTTT